MLCEGISYLLFQQLVGGVIQELGWVWLGRGRLSLLHKVVSAGQEI